MFKKCCNNEECNHRSHNYSCTGSIYGIGGIGAAIHFIGAASGFWGTVVAILKSFVWPAYLVYEAFQALAA